MFASCSGHVRDVSSTVSMPNLPKQKGVQMAGTSSSVEFMSSHVTKPFNLHVELNSEGCNLSRTTKNRQALS